MPTIIESFSKELSKCIFAALEISNRSHIKGGRFERVQIFCNVLRSNKATLNCPTKEIRNKIIFPGVWYDIGVLEKNQLRGQTLSAEERKIIEQALPVIDSTYLDIAQLFAEQQKIISSMNQICRASDNLILNFVSLFTKEV